MVGYENMQSMHNEIKNLENISTETIGICDASNIMQFIPQHYLRMSHDIACCRHRKLHDLHRVNCSKLQVGNFSLKSTAIEHTVWQTNKYHKSNKKMASSPKIILNPIGDDL